MEESRPDLEVRLLGPPMVIQREERVSIPRRKAQALLYYLICDRRAHARDKLATLLWEEFDDTRARRNLSNAISALRRALGVSPEGRSYVLAEGDTLRFNTATDYRLDAALFEHLATVALKETQEQGEPLLAACTRLEEAVELYRGDFLEGFVLQECLAFQDWIRNEQQRLLSLLTEALQVLAHHHEGWGEYRQAAAFVARLSQIDDWNEEFHRWLMSLYDLDGDRAAALRQYELCHQILEREGLTVGPETEALYQRIVQHETAPRRRERYELREELGRGRMGAVYRAWDTLLEREVALKMLSEVGLDEEALARFRREYRALARLKHPNIVTLYEIGKRQDVPYIAMELVEGQSVRRVHPVDIPQAVDIAMQMCAALGHAHRQGVVHRDVRPENAVITPEGMVKILDFGLARILGLSTVTGSGELVGTPLYMSPEQIRSGAVDERSDLYSLGVVLYELVTGRPPFQGEPWKVMRAHLEDTPPSPRLLNPAVSPALERVILKLLSKPPRERFASAAAARKALEELPEQGLPPPAAAAAPKVTPVRLVGRQEEWAGLVHLWQRVTGEEEGHLVFLCGEPGIGKTRLAEAFISHVEKQPGEAVVMRGGCRELLLGLSYAPWADALRGYLRALPAEEIVEITGAESAGLVRLVPELLERLPSPPRPLPPLGHQAERLRLFDQVADFLVRLSCRTPLLLFLDDLHWADMASLQLLEHTLRRAEEGRILFLGAYRTGEVGPEHSLQENQQRMQRTGRAVTLELSRLSAAEVKRLTEALLGEQEVSPALADAIYRETEGNPFFVEEMLKALWEEDEIRLTTTGWERWRKGTLAVPGSIQAVLNRRLDRLSVGCRHALIQVSAMGQEFDFDVLKALMSMDDEELLELLDEALEARVVDEVVLGEGEVYRFHHALIARVLYERMSSRRQALIHRRIGRIMESLHAGNLAAHADELAYHFFQGVRGDQGREEALRYSLLAAERAETIYANQEAVRHYRRALGLLRGSGQEAQRLRILEHLADVYATLEPREAVPLYEEALALWGEVDGDKMTGARLHRKLAGLAAGWAPVLGLPYDLGQIEALIEGGLELLRDGPLCIERLRLLLAWPTESYDYETGRRRAEEAMALAEQLGAADELARAVDELEWIYRRRGELCQARDLLFSHLEQIEREASLQPRAEIHRMLGQVLAYMGEYPQAIEYLALARQEYEQAGHTLLACAAQFFAAYAYVQWDHWPEAYQSGVEGIEMRRKWGLGPWHIPLVLARVHAVWGDAEGVERQRLEAMNEKDEFQPRVASYLSAQLSMAEGDFTAARGIFEDILSWGPPDEQVCDHTVYPYLAECAARTGDGETALHYAALAEEVARRGGSRPWLALALRAQGLVHTEREEWAEAEACLEEALALFQGMGCRWEEGRALVDLARLHRRRGESGDREPAWQHYQEALNRFEELWAKPDVERIQREMLNL